MRKGMLAIAVVGLILAAGSVRAEGWETYIAGSFSNNTTWTCSIGKAVTLKYVIIDPVATDTVSFTVEIRSPNYGMTNDVYSVFTYNGTNTPWTELSIPLWNGDIVRFDSSIAASTNRYLIAIQDKEL